MKKFILLLFISSNVFATNHYFSATGNDANNGLSPAAAQQSLIKLNADIPSYQPGDSVLFKAGDIFYGTIYANKIGLIFWSYGSGAKPTITGFTTVPAWQNIGGNIWESSTAVSTLNTCNMVTVNGSLAPIGRFPNSGYLTYTTTGMINRIKCTGLTTNWSGADVVLKTERFIISRRTIAAQNVDSIIFNPIWVYLPKNNYGLFIQNDVRTLDTLNEVYYNPATNKLRIYSPTSPVNVKLSTVDSLFVITAKNITIGNINFTGSNGETIAKPKDNSYSGITIKNCSIDFSGCNAINFNVGDNLNIFIDSCTISNTNSNGIVLGAGCNYATITNNLLQNTGSIAGMSKDSIGNYCAILTGGKKTVIEKNIVKNTGYNGISFGKDSCTVRYNLVDSFCFVKDDGAGIYTYNGSAKVLQTGNIVAFNTVLNGIGSNHGTSPITSESANANGIYFDDYSSGFVCNNNSVANCVKSGIFFHNTKNFTAIINTCYGNLFGLQITNDKGAGTIVNAVIKNNIFIAKANQYAASFFSRTNDAVNMGTIDSNIYSRPIDDSATIKFEYPGLAWGYKTLSFWQNYSGKDTYSSKLYKSINNSNQLDFQYNTTASPAPYYFNGFSKTDAKGLIYNNSAAIPAYSSFIFIYNGITTQERARYVNIKR
jgi:hypothetical protein